MPDHDARLAGLYVIADTGVIAAGSLLEKTSQALAGGARLIQYRDKTNDDVRRRDECDGLLTRCRQYNAMFVVNDDVELALDIGADGVHLGKLDVLPAAARKRAGKRLLIGASCYNELERATQFHKDGADYLAFGRFYPSAVKPGAPQANPALLADAKSLSLPLAAIGGIDADNATPLIDAGADMIAVISAVFATPDTEAQCRRLAALFPS